MPPQPAIGLFGLFGGLGARLFENPPVYREQHSPGVHGLHMRYHVAPVHARFGPPSRLVKDDTEIALRFGIAWIGRGELAGDGQAFPIGFVGSGKIALAMASVAKRNKDNTKIAPQFGTARIGCSKFAGNA